MVNLETLAKSNERANKLGESIEHAILEKQYKEFFDVLEGENGVKNCLDTHFGEKGTLIEIIDKFFGEKGQFLELFSLELPHSPFNLIKNEFPKF